ncbi:MAG: hypothetical protein JWO05_3850 [Gemmatimonadetes bacterium]|nr:hypothetical protein [Gemmatimonadota bacterium]
MAKRETISAEFRREFELATALDIAERKAGLRAASVSYDRKTRRFMIELTHGVLFGFPVSLLPHLANATARELSSVEASPGGYGIGIESLDADYSVPGLLEFSFGRRHLASLVSAANGRVKSRAKAAASRENGKKGGRPRKKGGSPRKKAAAR